MPWKFSLVSQPLEIGYIFEFSPLIARRYFALLCMKGKIVRLENIFTTRDRKKEEKGGGEGSS